MQWRRKGREVREGGMVVISYLSADGRYQIDSCRLKKPNYHGGTWEYSEYFLFEIATGKVKVFSRLRDAKKAAKEWEVSNARKSEIDC